MSTNRHRILEAFLACCLFATPTKADTTTAPNEAATPVNQRQTSGNTCGPAALISSFRCGNTAWQRGAQALPDGTDHEQIVLWIRRHGLQPSSTLKNRKRWTRDGINVEDLVVAANEMTRPLYLPPVTGDDLFLRRSERPEQLLRRTHEQLARSLAKGIPPLLSLRRFVLRKGHWTPIEGHFITITAVPRKLAREEHSFVIRYLDPWGGKRGEGSISLPNHDLLHSPGQSAPCLHAILPDAHVGKNQVRPGEKTALVPAAMIGRW
ncbi:MAG: hypothetical protein EAZ84_04930 [Verrucomicrobia bacterium]|nr:MAG: hypothetical protein EAZ84_04930 [Verrucomicrobiota bacterium]TAE88648.1 MAG: hypothetical protein EAZ82_02765 [Verrucomicrobiota bacterium]TAF26450.1 MAG: hypothetical protein EAZ71_04290 [Verrucomicrobiota bacterium]